MIGESTPPDTSPEAQTIEKFKGRDKVGVVGEATVVLGGTAAGAVAAGAVAGAAGATTLLGSTALGSLLGGVFVAATPVGWVVGTAVAGGMIGLAVTKLVQSGARNDERREGVVQRMQTRMRQQINRAAMGSTEAARFETLIELVVAAGRISADDAHRFKAVVKDGRMPHGLAIERLTAMLPAPADRS